ncbi:unnamed protein product [Choristocarpus tenellus]
MDGREIDGARVVVQRGRGHRPNGPKFATRRTEHRVLVEGLDSHTSWQDLKARLGLDSLGQGGVDWTELCVCVCVILECMCAFVKVMSVSYRQGSPC